MSLNVDLSELLSNAKRMSGEDFNFRLKLDKIEMDPLDITLTTTGVDIELSEINFEHGLASHEGRQILLYISDHSFRDKIDNVLEDGAQGNKFHVADCRTIKEYRARDEKRFERYKITNNLSGSFNVSGTNQYTNVFTEGQANLKVCKNCLTKLNYKGYQNDNSIFKIFSIEEFFSIYSSFFEYLPNRSLSGLKVDRYTDDWKKVSKEIKKVRAYKCEQCRVDLSSHENLLHVHHKNGIKNDNAKLNLAVFCADCHRKEPYHAHLFVPISETKIINALRKKQSLSHTDGWEGIFKYTDPSLEGLLKMCQKKSLPVPKFSYELLDDYDEICAQLDLAWKRSKVCVVIRGDDRNEAERKGWEVWSMTDALDEFIRFSSRLR